MLGNAQFPAYFSYNVENGGPANEVYCIKQDNQGYIWIGCDAGLYRFNGVRFEHFTSPDLTSRSVSGVCQSSTGRIYAYNFNGQLLYVENGRLRVLKKWSNNINQIAPDGKGKVWLSTTKGLICLDEKTMTWKAIQDLDGDGIPEKDNYAKSVRESGNGDVFYFHMGRLIRRSGNETRIYLINQEDKMIPAFVTNSSRNPWLFTLFEGACYRYHDGRYRRVNNNALAKVLAGMKITSTTEIGNDIWITSHTGVIRYNKKSNKTQLFYPKIAFSSCMKDREGNYWFTTLHDGILRMPNLDFLVWNDQTGALTLDKFTHLVATDNRIVFAKSDGEIGELYQHGGGFRTYPNTFLSDFGALYYDKQDRSVLFNKINTILQLRNGNISVVNGSTRPVKNFLRIGYDYIMASSQGSYVYTTPKEGFKERYKITDDWSRVIMRMPGTRDIYISGNHGLYRLIKVNGIWKVDQHLFKDEQISSITNDGKNIYALSFKGVIYRIQPSGEKELFYRMPDNFRAIQLISHTKKLFVATNNGLLILNTTNRRSMVINRMHGLSSNNINQVCIIGNYCWLATGKGLHRIPLHLLQQSFIKGNIILKKILVNGNPVSPSALRHLAYNDQFSISVDGLCYKANGNFSFAYRFVGDQEGWIQLPANAEVLSIPRLPLGSKVMELKMIDHEGRDSENILRFDLYVKPPFYQRWWFYLGTTLSLFGLSFLVFKKRIQQLRKKQDQRLKQLRLENELRLTQQNALKAQMNPHFLFNVLNSIKGYIYENDKKNAAKYLSDFSNLVRKVLEMSSKPQVTLKEELDVLELYIQLEAMLMHTDFTYEIQVEANVDVTGIRIPALLIQPYVENAFKHGLRHKQGPKLLRLNCAFDEQEGILSIRITDNGIGRKASQVINEQHRSNHESFATSAMEKRLALLNSDRPDLVGVEILDLTGDSTGDGTGTEVIIRIHI
jgi:hypothetical protein